MFQYALVFFLVLRGLINLVGCSTAALLLDVSREAEGLSTTTRVGPFIAPVLELRFL